MKKRYRNGENYDIPDSEDYTLLDAEAQPKYENVNPGTVTVEGFGIECWDFEMTKPRSKTIMVNHSAMPNVSAAKLLRGWTNCGEEVTGWAGVRTRMNLISKNLSALWGKLKKC